MPNAIALVAEFAPRRLRATMFILMFTGVTFGGGCPGWCRWPGAASTAGRFCSRSAACFRSWPRRAWRWVSGIDQVPGAEGRAARAGGEARAQLQPGIAVAPDAEFVIRDEKRYGNFSIRQLFGGGLALITPLLWLLFAANLMVFYFLLKLDADAAHQRQHPVAKAATATALFQLGGTIGGLVLARPIDRMGLAPVTLLFVLAVPVVASIGLRGRLSEPLLMIVMFLGGFCVLGLQFGLNAASAPDLSDRFPLERGGVGARRGAGRLDRRAAGRRRAHLDEAAGAAALCLGGGAVRRRRRGVLRSRAAVRDEVRRPRARPARRHGGGASRSRHERVRERAARDTGKIARFPRGVSSAGRAADS